MTMTRGNTQGVIDLYCQLLSFRRAMKFSFALFFLVLLPSAWSRYTLGVRDSIMIAHSFHGNPSFGPAGGMVRWFRIQYSIL